MASLTKALKRANEQSEEEKKKGVSLSGLLNTIDGKSFPSLFRSPIPFFPIKSEIVLTSQKE